MAAASVPRLFPGSTIVCVASGPSLTRDDVDWCRGKAPVVAVNDTYRWAPWADVLYAADPEWWEAHDGAAGFAGLKFSLHGKAGRWPGVQVLEKTGELGLELTPTGLRRGMNSGYQAINVAVHLGASRIVLLGYDMQMASGVTHFFGEHPAGRMRRKSDYAAFCACFDSLVAPLADLGIAVVNASRESALASFPRGSLREALA